jgi:cyclase
MSVTRRTFIAVSSIAAGSVPFRGLLGAAQTPAPAPPATKFEAIRRNVGYFTGQGGTIGWLVNSGAVVVVDTQFPATAAICIEGLKQRSSRAIDIVFNTHHHGDHTSGNRVFAEGARKIVAHARVPELQRQVAARQANSPSPVVATATFDKSWSDKVGDETVTASHYGPGHTGGDAIVRFERANVVHMGDLLFNQVHPRVDRPGGASIQNWIRTVTTVAKELPSDTLYIAGHARQGQPVVVDRVALQRQASYFDAVLSHVRAGIAANKSKEEIAALAALPGFEDYASSPPVLTLSAVLGTAYDEVTAK